MNFITDIPGLVAFIECRSLMV